MHFLLRMGLFGFMRVLLRMVFEPRLPLWLRLLPVITILYFFSPIDILPDMLGLKGRIDDILFIILSTILVLLFTPRYLIREFLGMDSSATSDIEEEQAVEGTYKYIDEDTS